MISSDEFKESKKKCRGIFTFSTSMLHWYKEHLPEINAELLLHPTKTPEILFDPEHFLNNSNPQIINIGFFLRSGYYRKVILANPLVYDNLYKEITYYRYDLDFSEVSFKSYLSSQEYDLLLSKNIVFLDLYDSCANNIIIECIARNTPILVVKQDAVVEYLGKEYPFYYSTIEEASSKLTDTNLIIETHHYLKELDTRKKITCEYFAESFYNSEIYRNI